MTDGFDQHLQVPLRTVKSISRVFCEAVGERAISDSTASLTRARLFLPPQSPHMPVGSLGKQLFSKRTQSGSNKRACKKLQSHYERLHDACVSHDPKLLAAHDAGTNKTVVSKWKGKATPSQTGVE